MNTSHPIWSLKLKPHFSSEENECAVLTKRMHFHQSGMSRSLSGGRVVNRRAPHPGLPSPHIPQHHVWHPVPGDSFPGPTFNNDNHHASTAKLQAAATLCVPWKTGEGRTIWWGEVADKAEIAFLQCSLTETQAQPLQSLGAKFLGGEEVSLGG